MTEIGSVLTTTYDHGPWSSCGRVRTDFPWPEIRIVDADDRDVEPGTVGELVVRTRCPSAFSPGYLDDPDQTAEVWRSGWFHSGDAFRVDEAGNYYLVDRYKDTIRRRGENVSSFEVESIVGAYDGVHECAAVGVPGRHGDDDIVVFVIAAAPGAVDAGDLGAWVSARVPSHMQPTEYRVVDDLPRNATSLRVKKYELRRIARADRS
jgi:crotonobetaine/carnitine-CoA ligase